MHPSLELQDVASGTGGEGLAAPAPSCPMSARPARRPATLAGRLLDGLPWALLALAVVPIAIVLALTPTLDGRGLEQGYAAMHRAVLVLVLAALVAGAWRLSAEGRGVRLALVGLGCLLVYSHLAGPIERTLTGLDTVEGMLFLLAMAGALVIFTPLVSRGASRAILLGAWMDTLIFLAAFTTLVGIAWGTFANSAAVPSLASLAGLVSVTAWAFAGVVMLLARDIRPPRGPYAVLAGIAMLSTASLAYLATLLPSGLAPTTVPIELLYAGGLVVAAWGGLTWAMHPSAAMAGSFRVRIARDLMPTTAIMVSTILYVAVEHLGQRVPLGFDIARVSVLFGVMFAGARQVLLLVYERRARAAERMSTAELAAHVAERQQVTRALAGLEAADTIEATAQRVCDRAVQLPGVGFAILTRASGDGEWVPAAAAGLDAAGLVGQPLDPGQVAHIRDRLEGGAWRESASPWLDPFLAEASLADVAWIPLRADDRVIGLLTLGCRTQVSPADGERRLMVVREAAVVATALLAPALAAEEALHQRRVRLDAVIAAQAFHPVYQPIVDLETGAVRGYEALTRFTDGTRPDVMFNEAIAAGRGIELELATLAAAAREAEALPADAYLSLNLSPELASRPELLGPLLTRLPRDLMLEITEHVPVADYELLIASVYALDLRVRIAVDDAGAGYAGLTHILAVRPHVVKLDVSLVRSVDLDLARQALVGSMVTFALRTGAAVVAEGVETAGEAAMLRSLGVTMGQGYYFGRPERIAREAAAGAAAN